MAILSRFSPERVNLRLTTSFDYLRKARRLGLEEFHGSACVSACDSESAQARGSRYTAKKPARELRQGGSDYRCCIPALAGFVSPQSIAPDGKEIFPKYRHHATPKAFGETISGQDGTLLFASSREMAGAAFVCAFFHRRELVHYAR